MSSTEVLDLRDSLSDLPEVIHDFSHADAVRAGIIPASVLPSPQLLTPAASFLGDEEQLARQMMPPPAPPVEATCAGQPSDARAGAGVAEQNMET